MKQLLLFGCVLLLTIGCRPKIGDNCFSSGECSPDGQEQRLCDTTSPDGYCTISNCSLDSCPNEAACVSFQDDNFRFCMLTCSTNEECRTDDGYTCILADALPIGAAFIDSTLPAGYCGIVPE
jgi:hypothetical protein